MAGVAGVAAVAVLVLVQSTQIPTRKSGGGFLKLGGSTSKLEDLFYYEEGRLTEEEHLL